MRHTTRQRGFLLIIVIGVLAVLLGLCAGFLVLTRSEVIAVEHVRDKSDTRNIVMTAADWMISNIDQTLIDAASGDHRAALPPVAGVNAADPAVLNGVISRATDPADPCHLWWYKPYEPNLASWWLSPTPTVGQFAFKNYSALTAKEETQWVYLPRDFLEGVRARFYVQVFDPNAGINLNDWLDDCSPTQCQMTHMAMDALGDWHQEYYHQVARYQSIIGQPQAVPGPMPAAPFNTANLIPFCPYPYNNCWRCVTNSMQGSTPPSASNTAIPAPHLETFNEMHLGYANAERTLMWAEHTKQFICSSTPPLTGFSRLAYSDPDTGRSPVNVNTCYASGDFPPTDSWALGTKAHTMEAVFNIESLRRIVKIGKFYDSSNAPVDLTTDTTGAVYNALDGDSKAKLEELKTKIAYQYQETLVRYFVASYAYSTSGGNRLRGPSMANVNYYNPYDSAPSKNYVDTYKGILGAAEVGKVRYYCKKSDSTSTRFPCNPVVAPATNALEEFRREMMADLAAMVASNTNSTYIGGAVDNREFIGVDKNGIFSIQQGKLDARTASAVYDNIIPGKAILFPAEANIEVRDPLTQLHKMRWSRKEDAENTPLRTATTLADLQAGKAQDSRGMFTGFGGGGCDVVWNNNGAPPGPYTLTAQEPPYRQLAFGPDSFSTELTISTTNFVMAIRAQICNPTTRQILMDELVCLYIEIAPDIQVEPNVGTYYYREGKPSYYKTAPNNGGTAKDSMDCNSTSIPNNGSSLAKEWIDYRGIAPASRAGFYMPSSNGGKQTKRRVIIRMVQDQMHGDS